MHTDPYTDNIAMIAIITICDCFHLYYSDAIMPINQIVLTPLEKAEAKYIETPDCIILEYETCFDIRSFTNASQYVVVKGTTRGIPENTRKLIPYKSHTNVWCMVYSDASIGTRVTRNTDNSIWDLVGCSCKDFLYRSYPKRGRGGRYDVLGIGVSKDGCKHIEYIRIHLT